jgi:hypothetical protein
VYEPNQRAANAMSATSGRGTLLHGLPKVCTAGGKAETDVGTLAWQGLW